MEITLENEQAIFYSESKIIKCANERKRIIILNHTKYVYILPDSAQASANFHR